MAELETVLDGSEQAPGGAKLEAVCSAVAQNYCDRRRLRDAHEISEVTQTCLAHALEALKAPWQLDPTDL
jgi:hypothetical protein